uniref:Uncharacterized protein n=1 Tax=Timema douglasi TaxID=61478 RepID=A0A7R8VF94_TIMDO|nr:unnamed protein product [Timema douglasi]
MGRSCGEQRLKASGRTSLTQDNKTLKARDVWQSKRRLGLVLIISVKSDSCGSHDLPYDYV